MPISAPAKRKAPAHRKVSRAQAAAPVAAPPPSTTDSIVEALTRSITDHRVEPGARLGEQKLAAYFGVSRTLVRQALYQMGQAGLIRLVPGQGAFVAEPSVDEARQVFAVRRMLEAGMTHAFIQQRQPDWIDALRAHNELEQAAVASERSGARVALLGDFHVLMAELMGNAVLAATLRELIARCALITLMYQTSHAAKDSALQHVHIVDALASGDAPRAVALMDAHLAHVEAGLQLEQLR